MPTQTTTRPTQKALIQAVRDNPDLLERLLLVAEQASGYGPTLSTPDRAYHALAPLLEGYAAERLAVVGLNRRRAVIASDVLTIGNSCMTIVCPRQILRWALGVNAEAIIIGHNHPSGDLTPSSQDHDVTERLKRAGSVVGIPLLDHLIVGGGSYTSMLADGSF